ncbi:extensin [Brucella haematophila]|uniref:extensin-like domain-containing protein n=1 Tax=Brucella haematophila TaxID=419474 RepID=UPI00110F51B1|nr:extensin family protein [Brucella haematophila]TMV03411.1 extensin [Brucella haematophila]
MRCSSVLLVLPRFLSRKDSIAAILTLGLLAPAGAAVFYPQPAQAQTFIEKILKRDAQKAKQQRKRPSAKPQKKRQSKQPVTRMESKAPEKPASQSALPVVVPVPTPAPRPEQIPEAAPVPTPTPEAKPDEKSEQKNEARPTTIVPPEKPTPPEHAEPKQPEPAKPTPDERVYQVACPALISGDVEGKLLSPIEDGAQCGVHSPLSLTAIGKEEPLKLANPVTTNCAMAVTLAEWSNDVKSAAHDIYGKDIKITQIGTGSDYQCRKVNGASTGRVSEHAFGNALDIMSFTFSDGSKTELESGWNGADKEKAFWRAVHGAGCKLFMTVIGPDGDAAHRTNMHLDQGCHGKSCTARICQ